MTAPQSGPDPEIALVDLAPEPADLRQDLLRGLAAEPKAIACKYFYDARGSALFDRICEQPEYYPTRTELAILAENVGEMAQLLGPRCAVVEFGSGSGLKTRILLDSLDDPAAYVPIDISRGHLLRSARQLNARYPTLAVLPVCADFTQQITLPTLPQDARRRVVYFPGSTLGNFDADQAEAFLARCARLVGPGGGLLLGVDLVKPVAQLEAAYNDAAGVTAAFNLNLLERINRELGTGLDVLRFRHLAFWNPQLARMEMHLESRVAQEIQVGDARFRLAAGERIHTESSHKYTEVGLAAMARRAGWQPVLGWNDPRDWFRVQYLVSDPS